jgi:hypothetical protein
MTGGSPRPGAPPVTGDGDAGRRLPLADLVADPRRVADLPVDEMFALLEACAVEHGRLAHVERLATARLRAALAATAPAAEGLLTAQQAARRLGVSADYVRTHGEALGIAVPLGTLVRYDPGAIAALRTARAAPKK